MLYPFQRLLDFVFPPTEHELLLRTVSPTRFVSWYQPGSKDSIEYLAPYHLPCIQAAITACKFEHSFKAARLLGALIDTHLQSLPPKKTLLIPVPLSLKRERERGFNQVERALSYVGSAPYPVNVLSNIVRRTKHTEAQTSLNRAKRIDNVTHAFTAVPTQVHMLKNYERIILCDDVCTTGSTLKAVKATLAPHISPNTE